MKKKVISLLLAVLIVTSIMSNAVTTVFAYDSVVVPLPTGSYDSPKKVMEPGRVHWMNFADMSPWWGTALRYEEHVWSDYADTGGLWSFGQISYTPLDVNLTQIPGATGSYVGFSNSSNPTYYRDHLWYGTFQGVRIDYAVFPGTQPLVDPLGRGVRYRTSIAGAYVATALLTNSNWVNQDPSKYGNLNEQFIIQYSSDGINWTSFTPQEINYYWEHGTITGGAEGYSTCIAATKLPANCSYYKVLLPSVATQANQQAGIGPTKVSSISMADGAVGTAALDISFNSNDSRIVSINSEKKEILVKTVDEISLDLLGSFIEILGGHYSFWNSNDQLITSTSTSNAVNGTKIKLYNDSNVLKFTYTIIRGQPTTATISPNAEKNNLLPGIIDWAKGDPIPNQSSVLYNDYVQNVGNYGVILNSTDEKIAQKFYGTFLGKTNTNYYRTWLFDSSGGPQGVLYRVVPGSYVSTCLLIHASLVTTGGVIGSEQTIKSRAKEFTISTSADGITYTPYTLSDSDITLEHGLPGWGMGAGTNLVAGYVSVRSTIKIPNGHLYYRVQYAQTVPGADYVFIGPSRASAVALDSYNVSEDNMITKLSVGTTAADLLAEIKPMSDSNIVITKQGAQIFGANKIGTATTIEVTRNNITTTYKIVIYGDVTGDGNINLSDLAEIKRHLLKINVLTGAYEKAGDVYSKGSISISSLLAVKKHLLGLKEITQ